MGTSNEEKISKLWNWFEQNVNQIIGFLNDDPNVNEEYLIDSLNDLVLDLGKFAWEIREGKNSTYLFILSPNSDHELLKLSRKIISKAPDFSEWEFLPAKPPIEWDFILPVYDDFLQETKIDTSKWKYHIKSTANQYIIDIYTEELKQYVHETQQNALHQMMIYLIGEEIKMKYIKEMVIKSPDQLSGNMTVLSNVDLIRHFTP
jgi:hypothetical protein